MVTKERFDLIAREEGITDQQMIDHVWKCRPPEIALDDLKEEEAREVLQEYKKCIENPLSKKRFEELFHEAGITNQQLIDFIWGKRASVTPFPFDEEGVKKAIQSLVGNFGLKIINEATDKDF